MCVAASTGQETEVWYRDTLFKYREDDKMDIKGPSKAVTQIKS